MPVYPHVAGTTVKVFLVCDDIKMNLKMVWEGVDVINKAQDKRCLTDCCAHGNGPSVFIECEKFLDC